MTDESVVKASGDVRLSSPDVFKGMAIIGVVFVHTVFIYSFPTVRGGSIGDITSFGNPSSVFLDFAYTALISFYMITGYFFKVGRPFSSYLKNRILPLLAAYVVSTVVLTTLMYAYLCMLGYSLPLDVFASDLFRLVIGKDSFEQLDVLSGTDILAVYEVTHPLYFLQALLVASIFFYATAEKVISSRRNLFISISVVLALGCAYNELVGLRLPFYCELVPMTLSALYFGAFLGNNDFIQGIEFGKYDRRFWMLLAISVVAVIAIFTVFPSERLFIYSVYGHFGGWSMFPFFIGQIFGFMILLYISIAFTKVGIIRKTLAFIGRHSLSVYTLHMFYARLLSAPFVHFDKNTWIPVGLPYSIALAITTIVLSIYTSKFLVRIFRTSESKIAT